MNLQEAFRFFDIDFQKELSCAQSFEHATQILKELQERMRKQFKKKAKELHP